MSVCDSGRRRTLTLKSIESVNPTMSLEQLYANMVILRRLQGAAPEVARGGPVVLVKRRVQGANASERSVRPAGVTVRSLPSRGCPCRPCPKAGPGAASEVG